MKILLAGASGFLGKNFLELAPKEIEITGIYNKSRDIEKFVKDKNLKNVSLHKCDLTDTNSVKNLFKKIGRDFEYCIYLAANVNVPLSVENPAEDMNTTVMGLINFLQNCNKIKRFVYMSSAAVYDGNKGIVNVNTNLNPVVPYCISKLTAERYVNFFHSIGKIKEYVIIRFGGAFGKYSEKKFMTSLVNDIYVKNKKEIAVYGDGTNIINIMYAKDAVKALLKCLDSGKSNIITNLGQENMTITETVERVAKIFNRKVRIAYTPKIKNQKYIGFRIKVDFNENFSFNPVYSFEKGIKEFGNLLKNGN